MEQNSVRRPIKRYVQLTALFLSGPVFILLTNPDSLPLPLLVVPLVWLFAVVGYSLFWILGRRSFTRKQSIILSVAVAVFTVLLAVFQSIHQLTVRDVLLSIGLVVFMAIYMSRADFLD